MKRVAHPTCTACGKTNPEFESNWGFRMCYRCLRQAADWMDKRDLLDSNPFAEELFDGVFEGGTVPRPSQYTVIVTSGTAAHYRLTCRVEK